MAEKETEASKFNLAEDTLIRVGEALRIAYSHFRAGELMQSFFALKSAKFQTISYFKTNERIALLKFEKEVWTHNRNYDSRGKIAYAIEQYSTYLMDLLQKYDLLLPKRKDTHKLT